MAGKGNMGTMKTGSTHDAAKGSVKFGSMRSETSNMVKGKSSKTMNAKGGGKDKKQGPR
jgi:hypothetical protein